jgi:hypothetical protein
MVKLRKLFLVDRAKELAKFSYDKVLDSDMGMEILT